MLTLPRRALLRGALALGGTLALGGCGLGGAPTGGRWSGRFLTVATAGGALRADLWTTLCVPFMRATGCRVTDVSLPPDDLIAELRRQFFSGRVEWDVVILDTPRLLALAHAEPQLFARPPDRALAWRTPPSAAERNIGVPLLTDTLVPLRRVAPFTGGAPDSWADFGDAARFPQPRALPRDPVGLLEAALLAAGVAPTALYPLDLDRAFATLDRLRNAISGWWTLRERGTDALEQGVVDLLVTRGGDARAALASGAHIAPLGVPTPALPQMLALPRGSAGAAQAQDFLARALTDTTQAALAAQGYWPALATAPAPADQPALVPLDLAWWATEGAAALERFAVWFGQDDVAG
jgi:putative spermidine/putrescine transport system substrate-binding protein